MRIRRFIVILLILFFLLPSIANASGKVIFNRQFLVDKNYLASENQWQIYNNDDEGLYITKDGLMLKSDGDSYLIYPIKFDYRQYDKLKITLYSSKPTKISVVPIRNDEKHSSFELTQEIDPNTNYVELDFSLRQKFFRQEVEHLGINFLSKEPAEVVIQEISLEKMSFFQVTLQAFHDYWQTAPYSSFTVNLFPTPLILGWSALAYFLPIIFILIGLYLYYPAWSKKTLLILLVFWIFIDFRMMYEFLSQNLADYESFIKPPEQEKTLRNYDDIYQFGNWLNENLPANVPEVIFYNFNNGHFPRVLNYLAYPAEFIAEDQDSEATTYVIYNRADIFYDLVGQKLYLNNKSITKPGEIIAQYNYYSFIFQEK